jgi:hypothetical protein
MGSYSTIVYDEKSDLMRGVASVWFFFWGGGGVGVQISRILYINISEIWPDKRGGRTLHGAGCKVMTVPQFHLDH